MSSRYADHPRAEPPRGEFRSAAHAAVIVRSFAPGSKRSLTTLVALLMLVAPLASCTTRPLAVGDPIGPLTWKVDESRGQLIVYSDNESSPSEASFGPRSDYMLYSISGELLNTVHNRTSWFSSDPVMLDLPVGRYTVTARAPNLGLVTVPVVIQGGRTTVVDLTQDVLALATAANGDWVRLPNGEVIGSSAK